MLNKGEYALELLKKGDKQGLKEIFDLLYTPLCLFSQKIVGGIDIAEDIVQDVFISFWENRNYLKVKSNLSSYLYKTVRNRSLNYVRDNKIKTTEWIDEYENIYSDITDKNDLKEELLNKIEAAVNELPPGSRKVFKSIVMDGLSYKAAAEHHKISINTIKSQLKRATRMLSEKLDGLSFVLAMELLFNFFSK